jgi:hypothetical protein
MPDRSTIQREEALTVAMPAPNDPLMVAVPTTRTGRRQWIGLR